MLTPTIESFLESVLNHPHRQFYVTLISLIINTINIIIDIEITSFIIDLVITWYNSRSSQHSRTSWFFSTGDISIYKILLESWNVPPRIPEDDRIDGFAVGRWDVEDEPRGVDAVQELLRRLGVDVDEFWRRIDLVIEGIFGADNGDYRQAFQRELFGFFGPEVENAAFLAFQDFWREEIDDDEEVLWLPGDEEFMVGHGVDTLSWSFPSNWRLWPIRGRLQFWNRAAPP